MFAENLCMEFIHQKVFRSHFFLRKYFWIISKAKVVPWPVDTENGQKLYQRTNIHRDILKKRKGVHLILTHSLVAPVLNSNSIEETACETPMLTSKGISSFFKRGGYPLPVNSVILNTSIESAYPGAKKSIKNDWKCGRFCIKKAWHERTGCHAFLIQSTWVDQDVSRFFETITKHFSIHKNRVMVSIAIGFGFETDQKCDIWSWGGSWQIFLWRNVALSHSQIITVRSNHLFSSKTLHFFSHFLSIF